MLDGGIDRAHAGADHDKAYRGEDIAFDRQEDEQDTEQFHGYADPDQQFVAELVGNKARDQPAEHESREDQRAEGGDRRLADAGLGAGEVAGRPEEAGGLPGAVGEEPDKGQYDARDFQGFFDAGTVAVVLFHAAGAAFP